MCHPVCLSMLKHTQTHPNTHQGTCLLPVRSCMLKNSQTHTPEHLRVSQYSNTRKHMPEHLLVACVFVHAQKHAITRQSTCLFVHAQKHAITHQSTCLLPVCLSMLKHTQTHNRALACTTRVHGALETVQLYTGAATLPLNINLRMMHAQSMQMHRRTTPSSSWGV